jgi:uncharacterized protein RhaS with RHS repeats
MTYTATNEKDKISNTYATLDDALMMATSCYDGAGIVCKITDSKGNEISYHFTARGNAVAG